MKAAENILNAVDFIEENIRKKISMNQVSFRSTYTVFHFCRVFMALTGDTPGNYLRKRRLTLAAQDILFRNREIIDTALEYQFQTQEGFTRAFKDYFGITPGKCRQTGKDISRRFIDRLSKKNFITQRGSTDMKPKIIELGKMHFIGMPIFTRDQKELPAMWSMFMKYESAIKNKTANGLCVALEFYTSEFTDSGKFFYMPAIQVDTLDVIPMEMTGKTIPASKYAVFTHKGDIRDMNKTISAAYHAWLPDAGLKASKEFDFELYDNRFKQESPDSEADFYIPIE